MILNVITLDLSTAVRMTNINNRAQHTTCFDLPPFYSLPSIDIKQDKSAMDGGFSFVEQGCDKFVWNEFKHALHGPKGELQGCNS